MNYEIEQVPEYMTDRHTQKLNQKLTREGGSLRLTPITCLIRWCLFTNTSLKIYVSHFAAQPHCTLQYVAIQARTQGGSVGSNEPPPLHQERPLK